MKHRIISKKLLMAVTAAALLLPFSVKLESMAALPSKHPGYTESADGEVWTIQESLPNAGDKDSSNPSCWYANGTIVNITEQGSGVTL